MAKMKSFKAQKEAEISFPEWNVGRMTGKSLKTKQVRKGKKK